VEVERSIIVCVCEIAGIDVGHRGGVRATYWIQWYREYVGRLVDIAVVLVVLAYRGVGR